MAKERFVIRVQPASNLKELMRRVLYSRPKLVDIALRLVELLKTNSNCYKNDIVEISRIIFARPEDVEYLLRKLQGVGMLTVESDRICLSDRFSSVLRQLADLWESFLKS